MHDAMLSRFSVAGSGTGYSDTVGGDYSDFGEAHAAASTGAELAA